MAIVNPAVQPGFNGCDDHYASDNLYSPNEQTFEWWYYGVPYLTTLQLGEVPMQEEIIKLFDVKKTFR